MNSPVVIALASTKRDDAQAMLDIDRQVWHQCPYSVEELVALLARPEHRAWLARAEGQPAGFVSCFSWHSSHGPIWEIDALATAPPFRNRGIATALLRITCQGAPLLQYANSPLPARGIVATRNLPSGRAFEKAGFASSEPRDLLVYSIGGLAPRPVPSTLHNRPVTVEWRNPDQVGIGSAILDPGDRLQQRGAFEGQWISVHRPLESNRLVARAWCVRVHTFLYSGFWLEEIDFDSAEPAAMGVLVHAAVERAKFEQLHEVGLLVGPNSPARAACIAEGFRWQDQYRIYTR